MKNKLKLAACLAAALSTATAGAQTNTATGVQVNLQAGALPPAQISLQAGAQADLGRGRHRPGDPTAYIYVASVPANGNTAEIEGYAAAANGQLMPLNGSPFQENDGSLTTNGRYLFGINRSTPSIDSFAVMPGGRIRYTLSRDYSQYNPSGCGVAAWLFPDRTGRNLYDMEFNGDCANNGYQSFAVEGTDGSLNYEGYANGGAGSFNGVYLPLTFTGDDRFGYEATNNGCMYFGVSSYRRAKSGALTQIFANVTMPAPPAGYRIYIPTMVSADPQNHVAFALEAANPPGCSGVPPQLASFTEDANGNLTTTNTSANMPPTALTDVTDLKVSPAGDLVAVSGSGGLQVFHFNGANPPSAYTPLLTRDAISQMFWDTSNHLYAISQSTGKLHVFTVTTQQYSEAPGSPYSVNSPQSLAVDSLPR